MKTTTSHPIRQTKNQSIVSIFWRILLCPLLLLISASVGRATDHCGVIAGEHWTKAGAPHRVTCDINVYSLIIDPGVTIYFTNNYAFEVDGILTAVGTPTEPIVFTITNGTVGWQGIYFNNDQGQSQLNCCCVANSKNSGIRVQNSWPTIQNCVISNNATGGSGGGIFINNNTTNDVFLQNCMIVSNTSSCYGGGIYASISTPGTLRLQGTTIARNYTIGCPDPQGGGLYLACNSVFESNSIVRANYGVNGGGYGWSASGGGLFCNSGTTIFRNSLVCSNSNSGHGDVYGPGVYLNSGQLLVTNSIISDNSGNTSAVYVNGGTAFFVNCTVAYNNPEGLNVAVGTATNLNSIFFYNNFNGASYGTQIAGAPNVTYCDVQGGFTGLGNISANPLFIVPHANYMLYAGPPSSPCIDAGSTNPIYNDVCFPPSQGGALNDMGAYGGPGAAGWFSAPVIVLPTPDQYAVTNTSLCFSAGASGASPLSYQWYFGTTPLSGQTGSNLCFSSVQLTNLGSYYVVVTNLYGATTNGPFWFTVTTNGGAIQDINMYAGINIGGLPGRTYVLDYTTDVGPSPVWTHLATNIMSGMEWFYVDMDSPFQPRRFYRVELK